MHVAVVCLHHREIFSIKALDIETLSKCQATGGFPDTDAIDLIPADYYQDCKIYKANIQHSLNPLLQECAALIT